MSEQVAIKVENLTKTYRLYDSPLDRLKESLHPLKKKYHHDFYALNDVNFEIQKGETVGIIGKNGSGKSTLLKVISGVLTPTSGSVTVNGRISALLELGAGFNPELTGVENVYFNGTLLGFDREEMNARLDDILSFADIGEFVYQPVKTYSSGMFVRLAFAVSTSVDPEILIVDEALSVGDAQFQQKCVKKMCRFIDSGGTIVFVSHDTNATKVLCTSALLLDKGRVIDRGRSERVTNMYNFLISQQPTQSEAIVANEVVQEIVSAEVDPPGKASGYGDLKVEIISAELQNEQGSPARVFASGERVKLIIVIKAHESLDDVVVGFGIKDRLGQDIFGTNSHHLQQNIAVERGKIYKFDYETVMNIGYGKYTLAVAVHSGATHIETNYHWFDFVAEFEVIVGEDFYFTGISRLDTCLTIEAAH